MSTVSTHRLDAEAVTLIFAWQGSIPEIIYFGPRLADSTDCAALAAAQVRPRGHASLDVIAPVSLLPEAARGFMGHPGLIAHSSNTATTDGPGLFTVSNVSAGENKVTFTCTNDAENMVLELQCQLDPETNVAVSTSKVTNTGPDNLHVDWLSAPVLSVPQKLSQAMSFHGRWTAEFATNRQPIPIGQQVIENRRGRTSKEAFPGIILLTPSTTENEGNCIGVHLGWSGNHKRVLERLATGDSQLQMSALLLPGECSLATGESFQTPETYMTHSANGMNGMSQNFHSHVRKDILKFPDAKKPRPITVNTWEAMYFDHEVEKLKALADAAKEVGAERYVLDDGWFKSRNDDTTSLGDWTPDPDKYPDGLHPIVDYVVDDLGLEFGLWVEPEMINPDSDLFRQHPQWALQPKSHEVITGRNQLILDLANNDVRDYVYERLSSLLTEYRISYLKWDMNRDFVLPTDQNNQPSATRQTRAIYDLVDRLRAAFPAVEIESCASGGGRIDYEILKRTHRFWTSDSNDPVERSHIQKGFSYFFPPEVMGAHIGPAWCHTSGRGFRPEFRALLASYGHMGMELDLRKVSDEETEILKQSVARHKADRHIWHGGSFQRLTTVDENLFGAAAITPDKKSARIVMMQIDRARSLAPPKVQIAGLDPETIYRVTLQTDHAIAMGGSEAFDNPLMSGALKLSGQILATVGIQLPVFYAQTGVALALEA